MLEMTLRLPGTLTQLPALERDILDSLKIHEDYNDSFYWQSLLEEKQLHECGVPFASSEI